MLPKDKRLNLKSNFTWVARGKRSESSHFKVFANHKTQENAKIGISISKKNYAKAHDRNYVKRVIFRIIEGLYPRLSKDLNLIIMPKNGILETTFEKLAIELERLLVDYGLALRYNN